jgi:hypothetical protein
MENDELKHIVNRHPEEMMTILKKEYDEEVYEIIEEFLLEKTSERQLVDKIKDYLICSAEKINEDHDASDGHDDIVPDASER